jgi:hypothetical protein
LASNRDPDRAGETYEWEKPDGRNLFKDTEIRHLLLDAIAQLPSY